MPITAVPAAPPKHGRNARPNATAPAVNVAPLAGKSRERADGLQSWFQVAQLACITKGWKADAGAIGLHGEKIATETARVAETVEPAGKVLDLLSMTGPYAALFSAVLPFAAQIAMNHHVIPESLALEGTVPPAMLEAQISAQLAEVQLEAMRTQKEAEAKLDELRSAMNGASEK
jgi:hypothetical protein